MLLIQPRFSTIKRLASFIIAYTDIFINLDPDGDSYLESQNL